MERAELERQLKELEDQRVAEFNTGNANPTELERIDGEIREIRQQLSALQREDEIDEKVHAEGVPFAVAGVDLEGIPPQLIQFIEEVVKTDRKRIYNDHAIELEQVEEEVRAKEKAIEGWNLAYDELVRENETLTTHVSRSAQEIQRLSKEAATLATELGAVNQYRENAKNELDGANAEIARLNQVIADYEQAEEYRQRQEQPLAVSAEESTSLQEKADAVKKLFTKVEDYGSILKLTKPEGDFELVKRAELSEWVEAIDVPSDADPVEVEAITPPQFQDEPAVQEHAVHGEVAPTEVGQAETFEEWATREIKALKAAVYGVDANKAA